MALLGVLAALQYMLWLGEGSVATGWRLRKEIQTSSARESMETARNLALAAQVEDLKQNGLASVQDEARSELGMIRKDEVFYQLIPGRPATQTFVPYADGPGTGYGKSRN